MRVLLLLAAAALAGVALLLVARRRRESGQTPVVPRPPAPDRAAQSAAPAEGTGEREGETATMPTRFGELAEEEKERRHRAAERLKADLAASGDL